MMSDYRRIETTYEVWRSIKASHPEIVPFGSYTSSTVAETSYGFKGCDYPIMEARTSWDYYDENSRRVNEYHRYWLCVGIKED